MVETAATATSKPKAGARKAGAISRSGEGTLKIGNRRVPVSRLDKVFYPKTGFTKGQVIDYYVGVSTPLLSHLKDRPLTLKRYPDGVDGGFFYEKRCPSYRPGWVQTAPVWSERQGEEIHYCLANDLPSLIWAVNLGDLEIHTSLSKAGKLDQPTMLVFDLDPGAPAGILQSAQVALRLKAKLEAFSLKSFPKTSGSKGLQIYVPLNTSATYEATKALAHGWAQELERENPELVVSRMEKRLRTGKVFVDWSQNDRHKTTVCVYSLRAKERPTVSAPLAWEEVQAALKKDQAQLLSFEAAEVLARVEKLGDLFSPVLKLKQKLPSVGVVTLIAHGRISN
jgi:bifunctional non-homologous end joining protein LigD